MAEKDLLLKLKTEYSGIFDFPAFYSFAYSWFLGEKYDVDEEKYSEKVSGNERGIVIEWKSTKKVSDYFKLEIKVKYEVEHLVDVEVEVDGKKKKMNKGKITINVASTLISDYESKWDANPTLRFMREIYNKYIIPGRVDGMKSKVFEDTNNFLEEAKAYLELTGRK